MLSNNDDGKNEEIVVPQQRGVDETQVVSHGLKMILINDLDNNFLPVLSSNFSNFKVQMDNN
jgi:hypothetical protein